MRKKIILVLSIFVLFLILTVILLISLFSNPVPKKVSITNLALKDEGTNIEIKLQAIKDTRDGCSELPLYTEDSLNQEKLTIKVKSIPRTINQGINCAALQTPTKLIRVPVSYVKTGGQFPVVVYFRSVQNSFYLERSGYLFSLKTAEIKNVDILEKNSQVVFLPGEISEWYTGNMYEDDTSKGIVFRDQINELELFAKKMGVRLAAEVYPDINVIYEKKRSFKDRILVVGNMLKDKQKADEIGVLADGSKVWSKWPTVLEGLDY